MSSTSEHSCTTRIMLANMDQLGLTVLIFHSRNYMIHHRFEKYNPVVWIGRKELTTPRADISGMHVFVFQPEKRQEEARKLCQA